MLLVPVATGASDGKKDKEGDGAASNKRAAEELDDGSGTRHHRTRHRTNPTTRPAFFYCSCFAGLAGSSQAMAFGDSCDEDFDEEEDSGSEQDDADNEIDKLAKMSQENLDTKLVTLMQREQELTKLSKAPYQHVLIEAQKDLLAKNAEPPPDTTYVVDKDGSRRPLLTKEWLAAKKAGDKKIVKSLEIINGCVDKIVKLEQQSMIQVFFDIAEHLLAQQTTYSAELSDTQSKLDLCKRASKSKILC